MREAGICGLINYKEFNSYDVQDLVYENQVLFYLENKKYSELLSQRMFNQAAASSIAPVGDNELKMHSSYMDAASKLFNEVRNLNIPWHDWNASKSDKIDEGEAKNLLKRWEARFGKLSDPETVEKLKIYEAVAKQGSESASNVTDKPAGAGWVFK